MIVGAAVGGSKSVTRTTVLRDGLDGTVRTGWMAQFRAPDRPRLPEIRGAELSLSVVGCHLRRLSDPLDVVGGGATPLRNAVRPRGTPCSRGGTRANDTSAPESGPFGRPGTVPSNPSEPYTFGSQMARFAARSPQN